MNGHTHFFQRDGNERVCTAPGCNAREQWQWVEELARFEWVGISQDYRGREMPPCFVGPRPSWYKNAPQSRQDGQGGAK